MPGTFSTRYWKPAASPRPHRFPVRMHDLRLAHASWPTEPQSRAEAVMEREASAHITTTQKYLRTLLDADNRALAAYDIIVQPRHVRNGTAQSKATV